jgi:hypothetical protein
MATHSALSLRAAVNEHLAAEGLEPGTDDAARWVRIKIGPIPFAYPNTKGRRKILRAHDLHHLLAGYSTDLVGEAEMAAWELGSGLEDRSGVRLAIRVFGFVVPRYPSRLLRAFVRGRGCTNLLGTTLDDAMLDRSVADVRAELGLDRAIAKATAADRRAFRVWAAKAVAIVWGPLVPMGLLAWWWWS